MSEWSRLFFGMIVDLFRSRAALEAEIVVLRQQLNVLRRACPKAANPFDAVRAMMLENLDKMQGATQSYLDMVEKAMRGFPGAKEDQITDFKAYLERQVAANRDFVERLLRAKDFQEAFRIQVE